MKTSIAFFLFSNALFAQGTLDKCYENKNTLSTHWDVTLHPETSNYEWVDGMKTNGFDWTQQHFYHIFVQNLLRLIH